MKSAVDTDLPSALDKVIKAGDDLADPMHWDGKKAADFRNNIWSTLKPDLTNLKTKLQDLQNAVDSVLTDISNAGN
jgi:hypothetical protein